MAVGSFAVYWEGGIGAVGMFVQVDMVVGPLGGIFDLNATGRMGWLDIIF